MRKIILSKNNFVKAIFTNVSAYEFRKLLNSLKVSISNIPIIILNKSLIDLTGNDSSRDGASVFTIIGQNKHLKRKSKIKHSKGISEISKKDKVIILKNENKETPKENINQNKKIEIKPSKKHESIRVSEQKNLFTKVITITPYITPQNKMIMGETQKQKDKINKAKKPEKKEKASTKSSKVIKTPIKKLETTKVSKNKRAELYISKEEKPKENTNRISNNSKTNRTKLKTTRYSLQKKNSPRLVAFFSSALAPVLFGLGLAGMIVHKKTFSSMLIASSLAIIGFGLFANNNSKTNKNSKQLVKKI